MPLFTCPVGMWPALRVTSYWSAHGEWSAARHRSAGFLTGCHACWYLSCSVNDCECLEVFDGAPYRAMAQVSTHDRLRSARPLRAGGSALAIQEKAYQPIR